VAQTQLEELTALPRSRCCFGGGDGPRERGKEWKVKEKRGERGKKRKGSGRRRRGRKRRRGKVKN